VAAIWTTVGVPVYAYLPNGFVVGAATELVVRHFCRKTKSFSIKVTNVIGYKEDLS